MKTDIISKILRDFEHNDAMSVIKLLNVFQKENGLSPRITRCIVALANGDMEKVIKFIKIAETDWRDVIVAAETYDYQFNEPFL
jgi:hypothetical protein